MMNPVLCRNWLQTLRSVRFRSLLCCSALLAISLSLSFSDRALTAEPTPSRKNDFISNDSIVRSTDLGSTITITCDAVTPLVQHPLCPIGGGVRPGDSWFTDEQLQVAKEVRLVPYQQTPQPEQLTVINASF
ncbi:hypothetical protein [Pantanalinema sp. GBBB05]|uniref:hypothetical protein n=1 Tax=Pantanalinema sp. GBBB05 TaxID=2604139 RepID=UPI001D2843A4|nr:hypothetical protein [Pantanalinema sp. GBBB05]